MAAIPFLCRGYWLVLFFSLPLYSKAKSYGIKYYYKLSFQYLNEWPIFALVVNFCHYMFWMIAAFLNNFLNNLVKFSRAWKWYQKPSNSNRLRDTAVLKFWTKRPSFLLCFCIMPRQSQLDRILVIEFGYAVYGMLNAKTKICNHS